MKIPRWPFDKFKTAEKKIGTQMKSTGEVMAIGRSVEEAMLKAIRSLDIDKISFEMLNLKTEELINELLNPTDKRIFAIAELTKWDENFINKIENILKIEEEIKLRREEIKKLIG